MAVGFITALDGPVVVTLGGEQVSFPVDVAIACAAVAAMLKDAKVRAVEKYAGKYKLSREQLVFAAAKADADEPNAWDVARYVDTIPGATAVLERSLQSAGKSLEQAKAIVTKIPGTQRVHLARDVSGLYMPIKPPEPPPPLAELDAGLGDGKAPEEPKGLQEDANVPSEPDGLGGGPLSEPAAKS